MNITHVITSTGIGGAQIMLVKLLKWMRRSQFHSSVISLMPDGALAPSIRETGAPLYSLGLTGRNLRGLGSIGRWVGFLRDTQPNVVMSWLYHADAIALTARVLQKRVRLIWNIRGSTRVPKADGSTPTFLKVLAGLSGIPEIVIANSYAGQKWHEQIGYQPRRWAVVPNGFDLEEFKPNRSARVRLRGELGISQDSEVVGIVARFHPMKRHEVFFRGAALLAESRPAAHFVVIGEGMEEDNQHLMKLIHPSLLPRVSLLGARRDMVDLYSVLDVFSLTSSWGEGFSNALGEAMACAVPCVATDVGDAARVIGSCGYVVPSEDPTALASAWHQFFSLGKSEQVELGEAARQHVSQWRIEAIAGRFEALLLG